MKCSDGHTGTATASAVESSETIKTVMLRATKESQKESGFFDVSAFRSDPDIVYETPFCHSQLDITNCFAQYTLRTRSVSMGFGSRRRACLKRQKLLAFGKYFLGYDNSTVKWEL